MNPKILQNPYFYSAKMAPKKVDNLLTFKGANPLTLWRPKRGQPINSPAYIYMYITLSLSLSLSLGLSLSLSLSVSLCLRLPLSISLSIYVSISLSLWIDSQGLENPNLLNKEVRTPLSLVFRSEYWASKTFGALKNWPYSFV